MRTLAEDGYAGVEVRVTPIRTEIIIRATRTREVLGEKGRRIRELTAVVQKRFRFPENSVELFAERVENRAACAGAQAESLRYKLLGGLAVVALATESFVSSWKMVPRGAKSSSAEKFVRSVRSRHQRKSSCAA